MGIFDKFLKLAGKEEFHLDPAIDKGYLLRQCLKYGCMMIRGRFFSLGRRNISGSVFVGRGVKVLQKKKLTMGPKSRLQDGVYIDALSTDGVVIGDHAVIGRGCRIECTGGLQSLGKGVRIGSGSTFGNDCMFGAAGGIEIGDNVVAGQFVRFHSENHNYNDMTRLIRDQGVTHKGIKVGNNCWIGAGAVFLDGAELGDGCVVGANAVVTRRFPDNSVIAGVPARIVKTRGEQHE